MTVAISQPPAWCGTRAYSVAQASRSRTDTGSLSISRPRGIAERRRTFGLTRDKRKSDADRHADFGRGGIAGSEHDRGTGPGSLRRSFLLGEGGAPAGKRLGAAVHALCAGLWLRAGLQPLLRPARGAILCAANDASMAVPVLLRPL